MSESGRRFEGSRFESFELTHNPEILDNKTEHAPDKRCEAEVKISPDGYDVPFPFNRTKEVDIKCTFCPFERTFRITSASEGESHSWAEQHAAGQIKYSCGKWKAMVDRGEVSGEMPDSFLPHFQWTRRIPK